MNIRAVQPSQSWGAIPTQESPQGNVADTFANLLAEKIQETDKMQKQSVDMGQKAALGNAGVSLHDAQIASATADLHLRMMVQARNKFLEVYKEVMSMPV